MLPGSLRIGGRVWKSLPCPSFLRADFWEGDATKHFAVKKRGFQYEKGRGNSVNGGFGKLGVPSHHLKCEMKSPHLVDFGWDFVDFQSNLSRILADV